MKRIAIALFLLLGLSGAANAQCDGVLASGAFCGNSGASADLAGEATPTAMFDRAFCGTNNSALARIAGSWVCTTTLPNAIQDNITRLGTIANITTPLGIAFGGSGQATKQAAFDALAPTATRAGDISYWNGTHWVTLAGNNSGTNVLTENASGVPSWAAPGTGTITNVATGGIITGGPITTTGTLNVNASLTPQGRVTLATGVPVMQASFSAQTTLYYTPYVGNLIPLYDGTNMVPTAFSEVSITLGSNWAANSNYDMYVGLDSSTLRTCTGAVWTNDTTRAETHTRTNGILLNTSSTTCRYNNTTTFTCAALRCTYVGTVRIGSAGQSNYIFGAVAAGGTAGNFGVWNMYNRVPVRTMVGDSTATWTYAVASVWRAPNGNTTTMRVSAVRGYDEDGVEAKYNAVGNPGAATTMAAGVGLNSTTALAGSTSSNSAVGNLPVIGSYSGLMGTGYNFISAIEFNTTTTASTWVGGLAAIGVQTGLHVGLAQ